MTRSMLSFLLVVVLGLTACGNGNDTANPSPQDEGSPAPVASPASNDTDDDDGNDGAASSSPDTAGPSPNDDDDDDDRAASPSPATAASPAPDDDDDGDDAEASPSPANDDAAGNTRQPEVDARLAELNLPLPEGAQLVEADDVDAEDIDVFYNVSGMTPAEVLTLYQEQLAAAGYQIDEQDDEEIEFGGNNLSGEIEVDPRDGGTRLHIDVDLR